MNQEDKERIRLAFLDAAESPLALRVFEGHVTFREMLLHAANSSERYCELHKDITSGRTTVDAIVEHLRVSYPRQF